MSSAASPPSADIYDDQLKKATEKVLGAKTFKNAKDLLASDVDAVYIATPPYLHPEHFEWRVAARKHIFWKSLRAWTSPVVNACSPQREKPINRNAFPSISSSDTVSTTGRPTTG